MRPENRSGLAICGSTVRVREETSQDQNGGHADQRARITDVKHGTGPREGAVPGGDQAWCKKDSRFRISKRGMAAVPPCASPVSGGGGWCSTSIRRTIPRAARKKHVESNKMTVAERPATGGRPSSAFQTALEQLDLVAEHLQLEPGVHELLRHAKRELTVSFPVKMDDGSLHVFRGYRVQHNTSLGPSKGGVRYHPEVR